MALNFDADETSAAIIELLQIAYRDEPARAAFGEIGQKPSIAFAPCSQLALMATPDSGYLLGVGFGALRIPIQVPLVQLRQLHAELTQLLSTPN